MSATDRTALEAWVGDFIDAYRRHSSVLRGVAGAPPARPAHAVARQREARSVGRRVLTRHLDPATSDAVGPAVATLGLMSMLERMSAYLLASGGGLSDQQVVATIAAMLAAAFADATEPPPLEPHHWNKDHDAPTDGHHRLRARSTARRDHSRGVLFEGQEWTWAEATQEPRPASGC